MKYWVAASFIALAFSGCGFVYDEPVVGPYRLVAVDTLDQMSLSYGLPSGDTVGRVDQTVFAVGYNEKYVSAARHPSGDSSIAEYYYILREKDSQFADPSEVVRGPFSESDFIDISSREGIPLANRPVYEFK